MVGYNDLPEPQENIDLLVDWVLSENAEAVLVLHRTRVAILLERALGDLYKVSI